MCLRMQVIDVLELFHLFVFAIKNLHDVHPGNVFLYECVQVCYLGTHFLESNLDSLLENSCCIKKNRNRTERNQCQSPVDKEHKYYDYKKCKEISDDCNESFRKNVCNIFKIRNRSRDQDSDRCAVKKLQAKIYYVFIQSHP